MLQTSWDLQGQQTITAWSNCPMVELFLNGISLGNRTPDASAKRSSWENVQGQAGTLKAVGKDTHGNVVCEDARTSASEPYALKLLVEPNLIDVLGDTFRIKANGSDAAIITAREQTKREPSVFMPITI
ncbi:MAG: DUF4982 domain-containing protein [Bacteroidales bacterium]|nr:DUF4982 domain-containing protein [Bacteroidales bacterium]